MQARTIPVDIWKVTFNVRKVNGQPYVKSPEMLKAARPAITRLLKEGAAKLCERFDFASVEVVAKSVNTGEEVRYNHVADTGDYRDWQTGRQ